MDSGWDLSIPIVAIVAWAAITMYRVHEASRRREFAHRERLAMIERGLVPSPDKDPEQFERVMGWQRGIDVADGLDRRAARSRSAGVMMICIGSGVGFLIWMSSDEPRVALGVGGMIAMIGVAFFVTSMLEHPSPPSHHPPPPVPPRPDEPH